MGFPSQQARSRGPGGCLQRAGSSDSIAELWRFHGSSSQFRQQLEQPDLGGLSFEERVGLLVDRQWSWKEDCALARRLRNSRLRSAASVEDIDYQTPRGLDRAWMRSLAAESEWVK